MIEETYSAEIKLIGDVKTDVDGNGELTDLRVAGVPLEWWIYNRINFLDKAKITIKIEPFEALQKE